MFLPTGNVRNGVLSKQSRNRLADTENRLAVARKEGGWGLGEEGEGTEKYRLPAASHRL